MGTSEVIRGYYPVLDDLKSHDLSDPQQTLIAARDAQAASNKARIRSAAVAIASLLLVFFMSWKQRSAPIYALEDLEDLVGFCDDARALPVEAPGANVWKNLDVLEATALRNWLFKPAQGLNLTLSTSAATTDNTVFLIEASRPSKETTLAYLDGDGVKPDKFAHAVIHHAAREPPVVVDYLVGPLPISIATTMRPLSENYAIPEIPYAARGFQLADFNAMRTFLQTTFEGLGELTMDLFGARADGYANDTLTGGGSAPVSFDGEWRRVWMPMKLNLPGSYLHPVDLYMYIDMTSLVAQHWKVLKVVYNGQAFDSVHAFHTAWKDKTLVRSAKPVANESDWATRTRKGRKRDLDHLAGPRSVMVKELMVGYDCPSHALYLPATVHTSMGSSTRLNAVCVFEHDSGKPISRHTGEAQDEMGATKGYELVVRTISTVGNYDYLFDYTFMLDGTVEIRFSASGYLQGGFFDAARDDFGTRIRETTMGNLHDHVINYKVDMDVAGIRNTISTVSLEDKEFKQDWFDEDWGATNIQQHIVKRKHLTEVTSKFEHPKNGQGMLVVSNEDKKNAWGVSRAYAIHPGASNIYLTNLHSKRTLRNVQWAKIASAATRVKDTEPYSSSMWSMNLPGNPPVDFDAFFDDEVSGVKVNALEL
ncbi:hypothetical protein P7C70_g5317, partial [Phenoliferia sp. Uapishka_3]